MAYFDDPAHKAQWEKELTALREEKQRRMISESANGRKSQQKKTVKLPTFEELVQQAALRHSKELRRPPEAPREELPQQEAPRRESHELRKPEASPRREPKTQTKPTRGNERVRMTFAQLVAEEENQRQQKTTYPARQKQRTMEAGNVL